jgi:Ca2+/Na+ antiporter
MLIAAAAPDIAFLFAGAGLVLYIASRAAVDAVTSITDPSPGQLAFSQWIPIACTAIVAVLMGRTDIAIAVAFATSVAVIGLALGTLILISPPHDTLLPHSSVWPFIIPAAMLPLLAGFRGALTWWHALMMLGLGAAVLGVWRSPSAPSDVPFAETADSADRPRRRVGQFILSIALAGVGAWLAYQATRVADDRTRIATGTLIAAAILGPLLVLPILGAGAFASQHGRIGSAMTGIVALVLLNLCLLLPIVVLVAHAREVTVAWLGGTRDWETLQTHIRPVHFPISVWRVDTALLLVAGLFLVPISLGRWVLHKAEGMALTLVYVAYIIVSAAIAIRS